MGGGRNARDVFGSWKKEILAFEERTPWGAVLAPWKTKRTSWRRAVKAAEHVACVAFHVLTLKAHLVCFIGPAPTTMPLWERTLRLCCYGHGPASAPAHVAVRAWHEMRALVEDDMLGVGPPYIPVLRSSQRGVQVLKTIAALERALEDRAAALTQAQAREKQLRERDDRHGPNGDRMGQELGERLKEGADDEDAMEVEMEKGDGEDDDEADGGR